MGNEIVKTENLVAIGLVVALIISMFTSPYELSMAIATGLIGYIGGRHFESKKREENEDV